MYTAIDLSCGESQQNNNNNNNSKKYGYLMGRCKYSAGIRLNVLLKYNNMLANASGREKAFD